MELKYLDREEENQLIWTSCDSVGPAHTRRPSRRLGPFPLAGLAVMILLLSQGFISLLRAPAGEVVVQTPIQLDSLLRVKSPPNPIAAPTESPIFPYDTYILTQGLHGASYGHMAIDLAAGKGSQIRSPVSGLVTALFKDDIGNSTLLIENERYQVALMHGQYSVFIGQQIDQGQIVGTESNIGYTTDMNGQICSDRNCGHHTHLNIFDKYIGANVNPLEILK